jgi:hypothetical protein
LIRAADPNRDFQLSKKHPLQARVSSGLSSSIWIAATVTPCLTRSSGNFPLASNKQTNKPTNKQTANRSRPMENPPFAAHLAHFLQMKLPAARYPGPCDPCDPCDPCGPSPAFPWK